MSPAVKLTNRHAVLPNESTVPYTLAAEKCASTTQSRGIASTGTALEGEGEDETSLTSASPSPEDEPPDLLAGLRTPPNAARRGAEGPRGPPQSFGPRGDDSALGSELVATAREVFTRQPESARGPLPSLPREIREALYGHRWDRVLVDVRRSVERRPLPGGKEEVYTAMVATGNMAGIFGLGLGVADTAQLAVARAHLDSFSRLTAVPLYRGHTIYHQLEHSYHRMKAGGGRRGEHAASIILLMPRPEGWGLRCSDLMYELCNVVGLRNVSIRLRGRVKNKFYVAQCFQEALLKQTTPHDGVEATGMYVREVYARKELPYGLRRGVDVI
ncbi:hypothetical protein VOLCADRAFT_99580 [Volvox carteri f. nagariensis]|uniref:S5 DRBM domain-containing protein n=1 Tax=Volvox carteri f. nagariensis TaxID=3068 RepID=D8UI38_VOLCA|nr:uncharacterized protein VOLCADRAFT_99580 [Volvox carteri f. nagariensis]EFJ40605.1 hypothetical protein VOLCADRAFT_99580 [Volvox carteri f. nagariensis]|eukprot:XP_002958312.1 hypothetical protein VOLCADRAFT_99580 [Volvox carteri f. nagariensis]